MTKPSPPRISGRPPAIPRYCGSDRLARAALRAAVALIASCALIFFGLSGTAAAQINAEQLRDDPLVPAFSGGFDLDYSLIRGNVEQLDFFTGGHMQYQTLTEGRPPGDFLPWDGLPFTKTRALLLGSIQYATQGGEAYLNQVFAHGRFTHMFHPRIGGEVFIQYQQNEFLSLRARALLGTDVRLELIHLKALSSTLGTGYMFEYELINVKPGAPDSPDYFNHRWTNFFTVRAALPGDVIVAQNTLYVQPRFDDFTDVRILEELEVQAAVTDHLDFGTKLTEVIDTRPPTGVKLVDMRLTTELGLTF